MTRSTPAAALRLAHDAMRAVGSASRKQATHERIGISSIHLCIRLMLAEETPHLDPLGSWSDLEAASRELETLLLRPAERASRALGPGGRTSPGFRDIRDKLTAAIDALRGSGHDDPIGAVYESSLRLVRESGGRTRRSRQGAFYTPTRLIEHIIGSAVDPVLAVTHSGDRLPTVCDPSSGSGRFVVAAARRIAAHAEASLGTGPGEALRRAVTESVFAVDLDPIAVELTRFALWREAEFSADVLPGLLEHCRVGDAVAGPPVELRASQREANEWCGRPEVDCFHWPLAFPEVFAGSDPEAAGFDAVVGNPPFLGQMSGGTGFSRRTAALLERWSRGVLTGYADAAAAFLMRSLLLARPGGRVCLVQPRSVIASRDAAGVRRWIDEHADLAAMWIATRAEFEGADVLVCVPTVVNASAPGRSVRLLTDLPPREVAASTPSRQPANAAATWSALAADVMGVPAVDAATRGILADLADATADFRDQYYGLRGFLVDERGADDRAFPPIATVGLIDPAACRWGVSPCRIHKRQWHAPRVDRARLDSDGSLGTWIASRLVPKLMIATQTRTIEVFVDAEGRYAPCTPVLTATPHNEADLWRLGAALSSPVCAAIAFRWFAGAALTGDTIKLAAKQVLQLPMPADDAAWHRAGAHFEAAHAAPGSAERRERLRDTAEATLDAYRIAGSKRAPLLSWWLDRLPDRAEDRLR